MLRQILASAAATALLALAGQANAVVYLNNQAAYNAAAPTAAPKTGEFQTTEQAQSASPREWVTTTPEVRRLADGWGRGYPPWQCKDGVSFWKSHQFSGL